MLKTIKSYLKQYRFWFIKIAPYVMLVVFINAAIFAFYGSETYIQDLVLAIGFMLVPSLFLAFITSGIISLIKLRKT
jgi:hypothetical protein